MRERREARLAPSRLTRRRKQGVWARWACLQPGSPCKRASLRPPYGREDLGSGTVEDMRDRIRRLSWKVELAIVLALAFGWTVPGTLRALVSPAAIAHSQTPPISEVALWGTILLELILLAFLTPFLYVRGWTFVRLGIRPTLRGCLQGGGLALAAYGLSIGLTMLAGSVWPDVGRALAETRIVSDDLSWTAIVLVSIINPFYEEIFVCGYLVSVLMDRRSDAEIAPAALEAEVVEAEVDSVEMNPDDAATRVSLQGASLAMAVNISAAIRLSYHLYQGVAGVLTVVPVGLLFGFWFARTRQLWPLIFAHAVLDFCGLAASAR
jgi:uncharacterized protein